MKNNEEQSAYFKSKHYYNKQTPHTNQNDPDWEFQKVQSIYVAMKEGIKHDAFLKNINSHEIIPRKPCQKYNTRAQPKMAFQNVQNCSEVQNYTSMLRMKDYYQQKNYKNSSLKSNTQTNVVSESQSMEYLSSQQPSFSNKGQFTVIQDFNMESASSVKKHNTKYEFFPSKNDWQSASFAPLNGAKMSLRQKCIRMFEQIEQVKFMKESFEWKLKQEKVYFTNQLQEIKKFLFRLSLKYEKDLLQFSKDRASTHNKSLQNKNQNKGKQSIVQNEMNELRQYCRKLQEDKDRSEQRYQKTLKMYQQQIQLISQQLQKKMALEKSLRANQQKNFECESCLSSMQRKNFYSYQIEIWKNRLKEQQQKHAKAMQRLEQKVFSLQQQFEFLQNQKNNAQKTLKQKQKELVYRESQIQYRLKDMERRQRQLEMKQSMLQKQRQELQRKKQKITDYQLKFIKEERRLKLQTKQKQILSSEYFNTAEKRNILSRNNNAALPERSESNSSRSSKVDVSTRLRQIQMMRNNGTRNFMENGSSRNSSNQSRFTSARQLNSPRTIQTSKHIKDYGIGKHNATQKQYGRQNNQMIKLSQKLSNLTQNLQKQLRQIN